MRSLFGLLALLLGVVSIAITARYGYKLADTEVDGYIGAVMFGAIALCAFVFDAAAVRLWFTGFRKVALFIGLIAAAALIVTFGNSLGGIVSRADKTLADRQKVSDSSKADRLELARLLKERSELPAFVATDADAVRAAQRAADTATKTKDDECRKRGPKCRDREVEELRASSALATAAANKSATDRAAKLEDAAEKVRARLEAAAPVQSVNPLGATLEQLMGIAAASLTAWQSAIIAGVFELCLVGVMVIFEVLGHAHRKSPPAVKPETAIPLYEEPRAPMKVDQQPALAISEPKIALPPKPKPQLVSNLPPAVAVADFAIATLEAKPGARVDVDDFYIAYAESCARDGKRTLTPDQFMPPLKKLCRQTGIGIQKSGERVYLQDVAFAHGVTDGNRASAHDR